MKNIAVLGSTGSIGTQTLEVLDTLRDKYSINALVAYSNETLLKEQCDKFSPKYSAVVLKDGVDCLIKAVEGADIAVIATRGIIALPAVVYCIQHNIDLAIANKETLVTAGELITNLLHNSKSKMFPVDSEHSAIWQSLNGGSHSEVSRLILTASGGAFRQYTEEQLISITPNLALHNPNWKMGDKITVDSNTMMNKAFEIIEARWLFDIDIDSIDVLVHPQSVVHSMVEYVDGSIIAQLATPDMKLPIAYALTYPERLYKGSRLNLSSINELQFFECDTNKFPCLNLGKYAYKLSKLAPCALNASNDICVQKFLEGKLSFTKIYDTIKSVLDNCKPIDNEVTVENIFAYDKLVRQFTNKL
ncbi:MAG: 1-deoxy-D-xylulose-5-phosphate reductoisomerase, partial [Clostridia bacterium]